MRFRATTGLPHITCDFHGFGEPLAKIIFCTDDESELLNIERALRAHRRASDFDFIRSEKALFEILPKGIDKGVAIAKLAEHLNISVERTIAIGDYDNDAAMLLAAGCGVAVANASRAALDAADYVTVSNEEHAVARVIADLEDGRIGV